MCLNLQETFVFINHTLSFFPPSYSTQAINQKLSLFSCKAREEVEKWMHPNIRRCLMLIMSNVDTRKKDAFMLVCSHCVAVSVAMRPVSAVWTCSAAVLDVPPVSNIS